MMGDLSNALNLTGVALPPTGVYEAGSQGVIDGAMLVPEGLRSFRVAEVFPYTLTVDGASIEAASPSWLIRVSGMRCQQRIVPLWKTSRVSACRDCLAT
ncbi:hypothetical protein HORIV_67000 [Vreelandella olivaria]|uniref:Uncharacterized protein n=1 Tax=Vreelandella olivaria TaxID=390919 RepID=A0ABN5X4T6_9GAMM|nr:hypothetical protein HORIV_67000 [Halomonas olivaria]